MQQPSSATNGSIEDRLHEQPLTIEGVELALKLPSDASQPRMVFPKGQELLLEGQILSYIKFLFELGYVKRSEFWTKFHSEDSGFRCVDSWIKKARKLIDQYDGGKGIIKTRYGSGGYDGGYYIGNISLHRNNPGNIVEGNGLSLNEITGCLRFQDAGTIKQLTPLQTALMALLVKAENHLISGSFLNSEIFTLENNDRDSLNRTIQRINRVVKPYMKIVGGPYDTFSYKLQSTQ